MVRRDKRYVHPERQKRKALERVQEVQASQRGESTIWKDIESASRKERRRFAKGVRKYDKLHGEGAAERYLSEQGAADDPFLAKFIPSKD